MDSNLQIEEHIDLNRYWQVIRRRWVPATVTFASILTLSLVTALASKDVYQAEAKLLIKPDSTRSTLDIPDGSPEIKQTVIDKDPIETEAKILGSRTIIERVIKDLDLKSKEGKPYTVKQVNQALTVQPVIGTDLLEVSYENADPDIAVAFVKRAIELYADGDALFSSEKALKTGDFIQQKLPQLEAEVEDAEIALRTFKSRNRISNLEGQIDEDIKAISQTERQIDTVRADLNDVNARFARLQSQLSMTWQEASAVSSLSQSVSVQNALTQLQNVKVELAQKSNFLSDKAPQVISLRQEQADLSALLEREIASTLGPDRQNLANSINILSLGDLKQSQLTEFANLGLRKEGLEQRLASLTKAYNDYQTRSNFTPQLQKQQRQLERRLKIATDKLETLESRASDTEIVRDYKIDKVRVISNAAIAEDTVNPDGKIIVVAGAMVGALFGAASAFLLDLKDNTIKNSQEVESMFAYPLHGVVPDLNLGGKSQQLQLPSSQIADRTESFDEISMMPLKEAYQNIQVNLNLSDVDAKKKIIAITSSVPQEGKSSVSANLAMARAQCGQKMLLIDADMRRPTQHRVWEIANDLGLSDVLQHQATWQESVQNIMPNLDVLTAGSIADNPIALLDSVSFEKFVSEVGQYYDQVIFDTPPIIGIADTRVIGKMVDGFLFVVRPGIADYGSATAAKKMLDSTGLRVLGVIVNGANMEREPYHYSSYYYAYNK